MKVIKPGRVQEGWAKEYTCTGKGNGGGGCGAILLVEEGDMYVTPHHDYGGGSDYYNTFKCPCCKCETDIPDNDLPDRVIDKIMNDYRKKHP